VPGKKGGFAVRKSKVFLFIDSHHISAQTGHYQMTLEKMVMDDI
jgi:hypothetical protein